MSVQRRRLWYSSFGSSGDTAFRLGKVWLTFICRGGSCAHAPRRFNWYDMLLRPLTCFHAQALSCMLGLFMILPMTLFVSVASMLVNLFRMQSLCFSDIYCNGQHSGVLQTNRERTVSVTWYHARCRLDLRKFRSGIVLPLATFIMRIEVFHALFN